MSLSVRKGWMRTMPVRHDGGSIVVSTRSVSIALPVGVGPRLDPDDVDRLSERAVDARSQQLVQFVVPGHTIVAVSTRRRDGCVRAARRRASRCRRSRRRGAECRGGPRPSAMNTATSKIIG
jgi:hypothetical protein